MLADVEYWHSDCINPKQPFISVGINEEILFKMNRILPHNSFFITKETLKINRRKSYCSWNKSKSSTSSFFCFTVTVSIPVTRVFQRYQSKFYLCCVDKKFDNIKTSLCKIIKNIRQIPLFLIVLCSYFFKSTIHRLKWKQKEQGNLHELFLNIRFFV